MHDAGEDANVLARIVHRSHAPSGLTEVARSARSRAVAA